MKIRLVGFLPKLKFEVLQKQCQGYFKVILSLYGRCDFAAKNEVSILHSISMPSILHARFELNTSNHFFRMGKIRYLIPLSSKAVRPDQPISQLLIEMDANSFRVKSSMKYFRREKKVAFFLPTNKGLLLKIENPNSSGARSA